MKVNSTATSTTVANGTDSIAAGQGATTSATATKSIAIGDGATVETNPSQVQNLV